LLSDEQKLNWLRLIRTRHVGPVTFWRLINYFGGAEQALKVLPDFLLRAGKKDQTPVSTKMVKRELQAAQKLGAKLVARGEPGYPDALARLDAPPPLLYIKGNPALANLPGIAIVGSRNGSAIGQKFTRHLVQELAGEGYAIVSGLARGIDTAAHTGAVDTATIAVIAGGIGNYYPPQNRQLQNQIEKNGLVITENPPGFEPRARDFPRRNRIISGSTLGTIVVEANLRSGSLITARLASEQGREVMAVPGHPLDPRATGTNRLIMNGASMITCARDVIELLTPMSGDKYREPPSLFENIQIQKPIKNIEVKQSARDIVLNALGTHSVEMDELIRATRLQPREVRVILLELELAGKIIHDGAQNIHLAPSFPR
jgi:DNA processing protein